MDTTPKRPADAPEAREVPKRPRQEPGAQPGAPEAPLTPQPESTVASASPQRGSETPSPQPPPTTAAGARALPPPAPHLGLPFLLLRSGNVHERCKPCYVSLAGVVCGAIKLALIECSNMEAVYLFRTCPALASAERVVLVVSKRSRESDSPTLREIRGLLREPRADPWTRVELLEVFVESQDTDVQPGEEGWTGCHHSKSMLLEYKDQQGLRVVITSANLTKHDLTQRSQTIFFQDFPRKDELSPATSAFAEDLAAYYAEALAGRAQRAPSPHAVVQQAIARYDFSGARAHLVATVPGWFRGVAATCWGHRRLRYLLNREGWERSRPGGFPLRYKGSPIVVQASSLGSKITQAYFEGELLESLSAGDTDGAGALGLPSNGAEGPALVWPTDKEWEKTHGGLMHALDASNLTSDWMRPHLRVWGDAGCDCGRFLPHTKIMARFVEVEEQWGAEIAWLYCGSANLSLEAWGEETANWPLELLCRSFELGVLLTPSREAAFRRSRWAGFSCTPPQPPPPPPQGVPPAGPDLPMSSSSSSGDGGGSSSGGGGSSGEPSSRSGSHLPVCFVPWQRRAPHERLDSGERRLLVPLPVPFALPPKRYSEEEFDEHDKRISDRDQPYVRRKDSKAKQ